MLVLQLLLRLLLPVCVANIWLLIAAAATAAATLLHSAWPTPQRTAAAHIVLELAVCSSASCPTSSQATRTDTARQCRESRYPAARFALVTATICTCCCCCQ